jgi:antitoxin CcdA
MRPTGMFNSDDLENSNRCEEIDKANWMAENRQAIHSWNVWIKDNGMPYDEYRQPIERD